MWAVRLESVLIGKAAELYSTLDINTISDFSLLKQALLTDFNKTLEHYQQDFRNNEIQVGKNFQQFSSHLQQLFNYWFKSSKVTQLFKEFMCVYGLTSVSCFSPS